MTSKENNKTVKHRGRSLHLSRTNLSSVIPNAKETIKCYQTITSSALFLSLNNMHVSRETKNNEMSDFTFSRNITND